MKNWTMKCARGLLVATLVLASASRVIAAPPGIELADQRGSETVLLQAGEVALTERDLLLYAILTQALEPADALAWKSLTPERKGQVRQHLEGVLTAWHTAGSAELPADVAEVEFRGLAHRIHSYPAARWVWADTVVRESVTIFPEDLIHSYLSRPEEFTDPARVTVRRLRVPIGQPVTIDSQNEARRRVQELRQRAETEGGLAPLLQQNPELLIDPPGQTVEFNRVDKNADTDLVDAAFSIGIKQISQPIRTSAGFFLLEVVDRIDADRIPLPDVRERIARRLESRFIPQQFDYLVGRKSFAAYPTNNSRLYRYMPGEADVVRVRDFTITKDDFARLYAEEVGNPVRPNMRLVEDLASSMLSGEVVLQDLERGGLAANEFQDRAREMSSWLVDARLVMRARREQVKPDDAAVERYLEENLSALVPGVARAIWRFDVFIRNPSGMSEAEVDAMNILMRGYLTTLTADAERQLTERRQLAANRGEFDPEQVVNNLPQPEDIRLRTRFVQMGKVTSSDALAETGVPFDRLVLGQFSPPVLAANKQTMSSYFVSEESTSALPPREELLNRARAALIDEEAFRPSRQFVKELKDAGRLVYHAELNTEATAP